MMAVTAGGTLLQHVPDSVGHQEHSPGPDSYGTITVHTTAGSRLASIIGPEVTVSCHHHQAVDEHPGLRRGGACSRRRPGGDGVPRRAFPAGRPVAPGDPDRSSTVRRPGGRGRCQMTPPTQLPTQLGGAAGRRPRGDEPGRLGVPPGHRGFARPGCADLAVDPGGPAGAAGDDRSRHLGDHWRGSSSPLPWWWRPRQPTGWPIRTRRLPPRPGRRPGRVDGVLELGRRRGHGIRSCGEMPVVGTGVRAARPRADLRLPRPVRRGRRAGDRRHRRLSGHVGQPVVPRRDQPATGRPPPATTRDGPGRRCRRRSTRH